MTQTSDDGDSAWVEGVMLLATHTILALVFFFLPAGAVWLPLLRQRRRTEPSLN